MKKKFGKCVDCVEDGDDSEKLLFRSSPKECGYHYKKKKAVIYQQRQKEREKLKKENGVKPKKINYFSPSKLKDDALYRKNRDEYMKEHLICEVKGCNNRSNNLHHKAGRDGPLLHMKKYFMACCGDCHPRRIHFEEDYPGWSRENKYIITVNLKTVNKIL